MNNWRVCLNYQSRRQERGGKPVQPETHSNRRPRPYVQSYSFQLINSYCEVHQIGRIPHGARLPESALHAGDLTCLRPSTMRSARRLPLLVRQKGRFGINLNNSAIPANRSDLPARPGQYAADDLHSRCQARWAGGGNLRRVRGRCSLAWSGLAATSTPPSSEV